MANQVFVPITVHLIGDGSSLTAAIILNSTPFFMSDSVQNFNATPDTLYFSQIRDQLGNAVPATAVLSKNGKQVLITFSSAFVGIITVTLKLGYNV